VVIVLQYNKSLKVNEYYNLTVSRLSNTIIKSGNNEAVLLFNDLNSNNTTNPSSSLIVVQQDQLA
jgi:hypothetical protein